MPPTERVMSFGEHLDELRRRLVYAIAGVVVLFVLGLVLGGRLLELLCAPVIAELKSAGQSPSMLATSPVEPFGAYIKVATVFAVVLGLPWILYQLWLFVAPGLYPREQRFAYFLLPLSGMLTVLGLAVLFFVILPIALYFLITFGAGLVPTRAATAPLPPGVVLPTIPALSADPADAPPNTLWFNSTLSELRFNAGDGRILAAPLSGGGIIAQQYRVSEYINLVFMLGLAFAVAFQLPLALLLLSWAGIIEPADLARRRKHIILGCVVGAAFLPTQDPWSLILLSALMVGLFEFGILLMKVVPPNRVARGLSPARATDSDSEA